MNSFVAGNGKAATKKAAADLTEVAINGDVAMTSGKDTFNLGNDSNTVVDGVIAFGDGKDTLSMGKNATLKVDDITGMEVFNASKGATLWMNNGDADVDFSNVTGSWANATILDVQDTVLGKGTAKSVAIDVYANEWDVYALDEEVAFLNFTCSDGAKVQIQYSEDGGLTWSDYDVWKGFAEIAADSDNFIRVGVVADEFDSKTEKNKDFSFTANLA